MEVQPVRRAYEQVAAQLREAIVLGRITAGQRLPSEAELCQRFGVSRSTVREALRALASEGLVSTARGASGGTFVTVPRPDNVVEFLTGTFSLLAGTREVSVQELLEARELLEVPAARIAAVSRTEPQLQQLRAALPSGPNRGFEVNRAFHELILAAVPNRLLHLMTEPVFATLQSRFLRERASPMFWRQVAGDHAAICAAIAAGDGEAAAAAMTDHLRNLRPTYERIDAAQRKDEAG